MGIYIKGMEMPKDGRITLQIGADGAVYKVISCAIIAEKYEKNLEVVELPPHGRLIDADEAISHPNMAEKNGRKLNPNYDREWFRHCVTYARLIIETSPTIIEAEDER